MPNDPKRSLKALTRTLLLEFLSDKFNQESPRYSQMIEAIRRENGDSLEKLKAICVDVSKK